MSANHPTFTRRPTSADRAFASLQGRLTPDPRGSAASHPVSNPPPATPNRQSTIPNPPFPTWLQAASPELDWTPPHLRLLQQELQAVTEGKVDRLMLFLPPRHGKSELVTVRYPVYRLERNPHTRVIIGAYNQSLAERFSRKARRLARSRGLFRGIHLPESGERSGNRTLPPGLPGAPGSAAVSEGGRRGLRSAASDWETAPTAHPHTHTPTHSPGGVRAVGVGAGVTGLGADLILIDDPVKSREEADSAAYRDRVWDWYRDDLYTRQEPGCAIILVMTRWHEDDLAGRILRSEEAPRWRVLRLPALAESPDEYRAWDEGLRPTSDTDVDGAESYSIGFPPDSRVNSLPGGATPTANAPDESLHHSIQESYSIGFRPDSPVNSLPGGAAPPADAPAATAPAADLQFALSNSHFSIPEGDPLHRREGAALWPQRFNEEALKRIKTTLGSRSFASLYQGRPMPVEGGLFKREWFRIIERNEAPLSPQRMRPYGDWGAGGATSDPSDTPDRSDAAAADHALSPQDWGAGGAALHPSSFIPHPSIRWVRFWDTAAQAGRRSDYWAGALLGRTPEGDWHLAEILRGRWEYPEARRRVLRTAAEDGPDVPVLIEDTASGSALLQDLRHDPAAAGRLFRGVKVAVDKAVRAGAWAAVAEAGRFHLVRGPWNAAFLTEVETFPHAAHDDQVDAVSGAFGYLTEALRRTCRPVFRAGSPRRIDGPFAPILERFHR